MKQLQILQNIIAKYTYAIYRGITCTRKYNNEFLSVGYNAPFEMSLVDWIMMFQESQPIVGNLFQAGQSVT